MFSRHVIITTPPNKNRFASRVYLGPRHIVGSRRRRNGRTMADIRGIAIKRVRTLLNNELAIPRLRVSGRDTAASSFVQWLRDIASRGEKLSMKYWRTSRALSLVSIVPWGSPNRHLWRLSRAYRWANVIPSGSCFRVASANVNSGNFDSVVSRISKFDDTLRSWIGNRLFFDYYYYNRIRY